MFFPFYRVTDSDDGMDEIVQVPASGKKSGGVAGGVAVIPVQGHIIDVFVTFVQHGQLPAAKSRHLRAR